MRVYCKKNFSVGLSNLNPKCPDHPISEKKICWKIYQFLYFWTVSSNFSDFWQKNNDWVAESALYSFRDFQSRKTLSPENFFPAVSDFELMTFGLLFKKFGSLTKTALCVSRGDFRRKKFSNENLFSPTVCELVLMIFRILEKNVAITTKAAFYLSGLTFCQKNVLERMNSTLAVFQGKHLRLPAGKCIEEISEGTNFAKSVIRIIFWLWERKFQSFPQKFPAELP